MFLGTYQTTFSGKGRIILPKKFREQLSNERRMVLTRGLDGCVWGFAKAEWDKQSIKQLEISIITNEGRALRRYIFSAATYVELDKQGRFVIPDNLLSYAEVKDRVSVVGAGDHFEVWDPKKWEVVLNGSGT